MTLAIDSVTIGFGGIVAVDAASFTVAPGEIVGLIGPNGAGKTTLINGICGAAPLRSGRILWEGRDLAGCAAHELIRLGLCRTFQNVASLHDLTVLDIVRLGAAPRTPTRFAGLDSIWRGAAERARDARLRESVLAPLQLLSHAEQPVQTLSYGLRKTVDLARALAGEPRLLLLDEPVAGLTRHEARAMAETILAVRGASGCAALLVEHKMDVVLRVCDRVVVMAAGRCIFEGTPAQLQSDPEVRRVYLGAEVAAA